MIRRSKAGSAYRADLASIHDVGFGDFARSAARALTAILAEQQVPPGPVVDLGCGSGILAREISATGRAVLGVDLSPAMIALARARAPRARFRVGSLHSVDLPACAAVAAIGECLSYGFDGRTSDRKLARLFRRIHDALPPGGVFLLDVSVFGRRPACNHFEGKGWAVLVRTEEDARRNVLVRRITSFRRSGRGYRRDTETHRLRLFRRAEIARQLRRAGFVVRSLAGYADLRFTRGQIGFLARKRLSTSARRASSPPSRPRTLRRRRRRVPTR